MWAAVSKMPNICDKDFAGHLETEKERVLGYLKSVDSVAKCFVTFLFEISWKAVDMQ